MRMLLDSEFLITELAVPICFTRKITLQFSYFVEVSSQVQLLQMFPQLHNDLKERRMDTLKDYVIDYPHVKVQKSTADIEEKILQKMCIDAAAVLDRQAGGEYRFGSYKEKPAPAPASQVHLLSKDDLSDLPKNNLDAESLLSGFGRKAPVAKFRNKTFTAKGIRNDVTLFQAKTFQNAPSKMFHSVVRLLSDTEKKWIDTQKQFQTAKILEKIKKGKNQCKYTQKCFQLCKSCN